MSPLELRNPATAVPEQVKIFEAQKKTLIFMNMIEVIKEETNKAPFLKNMSKYKQWKEMNKTI